MRVTLVALLAAAALGSANILGCTQNRVDFRNVISASSCGDKLTIVDCLNTEVYSAHDERIQRCFLAGGCSEEQSATAARWLEKICYGSTEEAGELRRAVASESETTLGSERTTDGQKKTTAERTTEKETTATEAAASTAAPSTAEASTTSEQLASTAAPSTLPSAAPSTTAQDSTTLSTSATASADTTSAATTTGSLVCSVTNMVLTTLCSFSAGKTISCYSTETPVASCAPGNICFPSAPGGGAPVCMKRDNHLTTSGLAIAIAFGACITGFSAALIIINARNRKQARHAQLLGQAASGSKIGGGGRGDVETAQPYRRGGNRTASDANLPLISPGGTRSDQQYYPQQEYFDQQRKGSNVSPGGRGGVPLVPTIQLHPGLGALDQGNYR